MTIISALRTYLAAYSGLKTGAPLWVNYLGAKPTQYGIMPLAGARTVETYLDNTRLCEFPFAIQSMESTADELARLESVGFYEVFAAWLDTQTNAGTFPTMDAKQTPTEIAATGQAYLYQEGESQTGIYQIMCKLTYEQQP